ncbi:MAG TPA: hypothetical protein VM123_11845 [archaeon]|nr:hypothetical protein [archaeon]
MDPFVIRVDTRAIRSVAEWFEAAPPKVGARHWKNGRSAKELAKAWCSDDGVVIPPELEVLLRSGNTFPQFRLREVFPEHRTAFDNLPGEPRNSDLAIVAADDLGPFVVCVEAKADEPFGELVQVTLRSAVKRIALEEPSNAVMRAQKLAAALLPPWREGFARFGDLRYQLLTGVAGTLAFAGEQMAGRAVFVVHELINPALTNEKKLLENQRNFEAFINRMTCGTVEHVEAGVLIGPIRVRGNDLIPSNVDLYLGKIRRDLK